MFSIYKYAKFELSYENQGNKSGFTHLLTVKDLSTGKSTGMWIDPTESSSANQTNSLLQIESLQKLKGSVDDTEYNHQVACFIESLIANGGYSCLEISSLMKDVLKHHKNPQKLYNTISNLDLSYIRNADIGRFFDIEEMQKAVADFVAVLKEAITGLLGIMITAEDAMASRSGLIANSTFPPAPGVTNDTNSNFSAECQI
jgi:hypothetical protein